MESRKSYFDPRLIVVFLTEDDAEYAKFSKHFRKLGLGFLWKNKIFIDMTRIENEGYTDNHVIFIESHEVAHSWLKHPSKLDRENEASADYVGILLCMKRGYREPAKIGIRHFRGRNGVDFKKYDNEYGDEYRKLISEAKKKKKCVVLPNDTIEDIRRKCGAEYVRRMGWTAWNHPFALVGVAGTTKKKEDPTATNVNTSEEDDEVEDSEEEGETTTTNGSSGGNGN